MNGYGINFEVDGQSAAGYLALPTQANAPGVIVLHAWWGLNPFFKSLCDRLAAEGFAAFAPDLYDGKIAQTVDEAEQFMSQTQFERKQAVVAASPKFLHGRAGVRKEALSVIGFSMGAAWSLGLASQMPADIHKLILFYGVSSTEFSQIRAEILGHYSDVDEWEPLDGVRAMESEMRAAKLNPTIYIYPGMKHWFFEENRPEYDPNAAELAWRRTLEFLRG